MSPIHLLTLTILIASSALAHAADDFPLTEDSKPQATVPKGTLLKGTYKAKADSLFPGTEREYQIYLPAGHDTSKPAPFMVFQDGVIYQAPTVFDNLISRKEIPPLVGIFIKPGVVPAANNNALPRYNRSYEYDSVTDHYARFLIDEFLPAIIGKHKLNLSTDPNARGIAGNSSGGICAFMVAWHRPDQFRRVFTGVGTYVGIHGADSLPVLVRKYEPKPLRIWLQSGENDNDLYCGDWWMANQMMERSLTWNGYDVNHTWGKGGHNAQHATQIFPEVLRWLWKGYPDEPVKANPRGDAKWVGSSVVGDGEWELCNLNSADHRRVSRITARVDGSIFFVSRAPHEGDGWRNRIFRMTPDGKLIEMKRKWVVESMAAAPDGTVKILSSRQRPDATKEMVVATIEKNDTITDAVLLLDSAKAGYTELTELCIAHDGRMILVGGDAGILATFDSNGRFLGCTDANDLQSWSRTNAVCLTPDQTHLYYAPVDDRVPIRIWSYGGSTPYFAEAQPFGWLDCLPSPVASPINRVGNLCVDTNGWLYVATSLGIQVLDHAGRVNFIIPTPKHPHDVCFGGKDLSELFIACGDTIYKRKTKAHGYISGQMAPIKPPAPKL